jgi:histidine ammonia-lyase
MAYPAIGAVGAAWADLVLLTERHITAMHTGDTAGHLPRLLERPNGSGGRTNLDAQTAASATLLPPGVADAQNDVAVPSFSAYRKERAAARALNAALALLAASSSQALWVTDRAPPPPLQSFLDSVRAIVPPVEAPAGRELGDELLRLAQTIEAATVTGELYAT